MLISGQDEPQPSDTMARRPSNTRTLSDPPHAAMNSPAPLKQSAGTATVTTSNAATVTDAQADANAASCAMALPRSVGAFALTAVLQLPPLPARLVADWQRETRLQLNLQPGDVEEMPLARARTRWPQYRQCLGAAADWASTVGLHNVLASRPLALMACRGARYHHDAADYSTAAFCNLFVGEDAGQDVHFPFTGQRIPLVHGTVILFDTGQPHGVIARHRSHFEATDFAGPDSSRMFLTWELPLGNPALAKALGIATGEESQNGLQWDGTQLRHHGNAGSVCPDSGQWRIEATVLPT